MDFTKGTCEHFRGAGKKTAESSSHYKLSDESAFLLSHPFGSI